MERRRCSHCRNPIRRGQAVPRQESCELVWFHDDCWREVRAAQQQDYERRIADAGASAAVAPYCVTELAMPAQQLASETQEDPTTAPAVEPTVPAPRVSTMRQ